MVCYYCSQFNTLGLNTTFYRMPTLEAFDTWHDQSPADYRFAVKAPRLVMHHKKFNADAQPILTNF